MPFLIVLCAGLFVIVVGAVVIRCVPREDAFTAANAVFIRYIVGNKLNYVKPIVEFEIDGVVGSHTCREIPTRYANAQPGDAVTVYYLLSSFLGLKAINTIADTPNAIKHFIRMKRFAGIFLVTIGTIFGIIAIAIA